MQTRRDQLHAYRFLTKRALAALVTGQPNAVEPPMRRLTITTISGVMIAVVVAAGFALFGVLKPSAGSSWKQSGQVIIEDSTGARYVYINNVLHPVLNYSSAVLAAIADQDSGSSSSVPVVHVSTSDIKNAQRGATIGIDGIPDSMPSKSNLISSPWSVCATEEQSDANAVTKVHVHVGETGAVSTIPDALATVVRTVSGSVYLLWQRQAWSVNDPNVATALAVQTENAVIVRDTFVNSLPLGPALSAPDIAGAGTQAPYRVGGATPVVGQLISVGATEYVALKDGLAIVNPLQAKLVQALRLSGNQSLPAIQANETDVLNATRSSGLASVPNSFSKVPGTPPQFSTAAADAHGICSTYTDSAQTPQFGVPRNALPSFLDGAPVGLPQADTGSSLADDVLVASGRASMVVSGSGSKTVLLVADPGRRFAAVNSSVLAAFGYSGAKPAVIPAAVLALVPQGPALDPSAALNPVSG